ELKKNARTAPAGAFRRPTGLQGPAFRPEIGPGSHAAPQTLAGRINPAPTNGGQDRCKLARVATSRYFMRRGGIYPARGALPRRRVPRAGNARPYTLYTFSGFLPRTSSARATTATMASLTGKASQTPGSAKRAERARAAGTMTTTPRSSETACAGPACSI